MDAARTIYRRSSIGRISELTASFRPGITEIPKKGTKRTLDMILPLYVAASATLVSGKVSLQFHCGDLHKAIESEKKLNPADSKEVNEQGSPVGEEKFDMIYLSNVPDYTGVLNMFTRFTPMLKQGGLLSHSVLANNTVFDSSGIVAESGPDPGFELLVHSGAGLLNCSTDPLQLLGLRLITGAIWGDSVLWQKVERPTGTTRMLFYYTSIYMLL